MSVKAMTAVFDRATKPHFSSATLVVRFLVLTSLAFEGDHEWGVSSEAYPVGLEEHYPDGSFRIWQGPGKVVFDVSDMLGSPSRRAIVELAREVIYG